MKRVSFKRPISHKNDNEQYFTIMKRKETKTSVIAMIQRFKHLETSNILNLNNTDYLTLTDDQIKSESFSCSLMISFLNHVKTCPIMMISCWCEESSWWWYLIFTFANYSWVQMIYEFTNHCIMRIESWGEVAATMCSHSMIQWISLSSLISCRVNCCASYVKMNFNEVICSCLHKT